MHLKHSNANCTNQRLHSNVNSYSQGMTNVRVGRDHGKKRLVFENAKLYTRKAALKCQSSRQKAQHMAMGCLGLITIDG